MTGAMSAPEPSVLQALQGYTQQSDKWPGPRAVKIFVASVFNGMYSIVWYNIHGSVRGEISDRASSAESAIKMHPLFQILVDHVVKQNEKVVKN